MESCGQCGAVVPSGASACKQCGAGLGVGPALDLESDGLASLPSLDKLVAPVRDRARSPGTGSTLGGARSGTLGGARAPALGAAGGALGAAAATVEGDPLGLLGNPVAPRATPVRREDTSTTGKRKVQQPRSPRPQTQDGLPDSVADQSALYGRGMVLDEDPFNTAFGSGGQAPALELEAGAQNDLPEEDIDLGPQTTETPEQTRRRQLEEVAQYGPRPANLLGAPAYWIKVMLRRRALDQELLTVAAQRKRAEDGATEAMLAVAEALLAFKNDERLAKVRKLVAAIGDAEGRLGHVDAAGQKRKQQTSSELTRLEREVARLEKQAEPLREREAELAEQLAEIEARRQHAELLRKKAESELEALGRKGAAADPELLAALKAERDVRHGDVQTIGVEMLPVQDDIGLVRKDLGKILRQIAVVQSEKQTNITVMDRAASHDRVSRGQAQSARQQALLALANAAGKHKLLALVPEEAEAARDARARAEEKKAFEELHRAAAESYDKSAYQQGMMILLGGSGLFFLSLVIAILF
jgi:hypothetical protein